MNHPILLILLLISITCQGQNLDSLKNTLKPKKFIERIEIFAGSNLSLNHGNKFIENYEDENVTNTRLLKWGWVAGVGVNHPLTNRIDLNVRLQYETKGTKNELNVPSLLDNTSRYIIFSKYTFKYYTVSLIPQIHLGKRDKLIVGIGGYYSKIHGIKGFDRTFSTRENVVRSEIKIEGRIFRDLRDDGTVEATAISRGVFRMEQYDYGPVLMVSYNASINKQAFSFEILNYNGLKNINRNNPYNLEEKNRTFYLIINYHLPFN